MAYSTTKGHKSQISQSRGSKITPYNFSLRGHAQNAPHHNHSIELLAEDNAEDACLTSSD